MPSVIADAMNNADASSSFSPVALLKRELERIQISKGMLAMRVNVMELGRFTRTYSSTAQVKLIMLPAGRERNAREARVVYQFEIS